MDAVGDWMSNSYDTCSKLDEDIFTIHMPKEGMKFDSEQATFDFYKTHARERSLGFGKDMPIKILKKQGD